MPLPIGRVSQIAFMTRDIRRSMDHFATSLGVGPWFLTEQAMFESCRYRGHPSPVDLAVAFSNCRGLEIELMQLNNDAPSMWRDFLTRDFECEQLHHVCIWPDDYDDTLRGARERGYEILQDGHTRRGRFAYLSHVTHPDHALELTESTPGRRAFQALVADAARNWNGEDAVRTHWTLPAFD